MHQHSSSLPVSGGSQHFIRRENRLFNVLPEYDELCREEIQGIKKHTSLPGLPWPPIDPSTLKRRAKLPRNLKVHGNRLFWQTDDYIVPPNLREIWRSCWDRQKGRTGIKSTVRRPIRCQGIDFNLFISDLFLKTGFK